MAAGGTRLLSGVRGIAAGWMQEGGRLGAGWGPDEMAGRRLERPAEAFCWARCGLRRPFGVGTVLLCRQPLADHALRFLGGLLEACGHGLSKQRRAHTRSDRLDDIY